MAPPPAKGQKGGAQKKTGHGRLLNACYEVTNDGLKRKNRHCPKCGHGTFMAEHKDRRTCGKCGYMEKK